MSRNIEKQKNGKYKVRVWAQSPDIYGIRKSKQRSNISSMAVAKMVALELEENLQTDKKQTDLTFAELEKIYLEVRANKMESTTKSNLPYISTKLNNEFGRIKIKDITNIVAQRGFDNISKLENKNKPGQPIRKGTVVRVYRHFKAVLNFAVDNDFLEYNKVRRIDFKDDEVDFEPTLLTANQVHSVLAFLKQKFNIIYIPVLLSVTTSLRRGEVLGLKWDAVDFENNMIHIVNNRVMIANEVIDKKKLKTKTSRRVLPISEFIKNELLEHFKLNEELQNDYVCANIFTGEVPRPDYLTKTFAKVMKKEFKIKMRLHDLRHTFSQLAFEGNVDNLTRSQILGHSSEKTTNLIYTHQSNQKFINAMDIVTEKIKER